MEKNLRCRNLLAGDTAMKVTTEAVQVFGGYGYTKDYPVERYYARCEDYTNLRRNSRNSTTSNLSNVNKVILFYYQSIPMAENNKYMKRGGKDMNIFVLMKRTFDTEE